ncbi:hypothetical protein LOK49_LG11G00650 [Camellia lanceoleosa]|uniref:Uncharacterized protein n=1 Tax=Camellia lanceoleosa TaxID=1840588 RepID=A0ACC0G575_9ERIC|nr:hypothetical protein LOK49_LG11G00650 [Camellia lanceoleosa]
MGDLSRKTDVKSVIAFSDDLVGFLSAEKDVNNLTQHLEQSKALQSQCDADYNDVLSLLQDYQKRIDVSKKKSDEARSEAASDAKMDLLQQELEEEFRYKKIDKFFPSHKIRATSVKVLIHHIGYFIENDERSYVRGNVDIFDAVDVDKLYVLEISYMLKELGVFYYKHIFYKIPNKNLVLGLRVLANDDDIREMYSLLENTNTLELFIEHHKPHNVDIADPVLFLTDVPVKDVENNGNYNNDHCQEDSNTDSDGNDDLSDKDFSNSSDDDDTDLDDIMFDSNVERDVNEKGLKEGHECEVNDIDSSEEELGQHVEARDKPIQIHFTITKQNHFTN